MRPERIIHPGLKPAVEILRRHLAEAGADVEELTRELDELRAQSQEIANRLAATSARRTVRQAEFNGVEMALAELLGYRP